MGIEQNLLEFWRKHKWVVILGLAGLFFALLAIKYSFLKALFIYLCIAIGVWIGRILDRKTNVREKIEGFFRND